MLHISEREEEKIDPRKKVVKMKGLSREVDSSWIRKDEILMYWSLYGSLLCVILSVLLWFKMSFSHKTQRCLFFSPAREAFVCCFTRLGLFLSGLDTSFTVMSRWEKNKSGRMTVKGKRLHSSSGRLASRLRIQIFPGSMKMAKCPQSFLPAGVWINSLESYSIMVNYLCSWEDVHRKQQRWLLLADYFCL